MKKAIVLLVTCLTIIAIESRACTCESVGNFLKASKGADLVALIRVINHDDYFSLFSEGDSIKRPMSIRVELVEVLKGELATEEVKIFGDNGYLCRESIQHLNPQGFYIVAIHKAKDRTWDYGVIETEKDYIISSCGEHVLKYNSDDHTVVGRISRGTRKDKMIPYRKLKKLMKKAATNVSTSTTLQ